MGRFGDIRTPFLLGTVIAVALAGCSSSNNKATPPASTSTTSAASSSTVPETSTSTSTSTTGATTVPATSAPTTTAPASVRITGFTVSPAAPVCNSPTEIQLAWTATGATTVELAIDGQKFASYPGGHQSPLEYFACDGKAHTYLLTAHGPGGATATANKVVRATATG
jgi:ABC-type Fe3+-hydroxamate transport system substrate-binding protein